VSSIGFLTAEREVRVSGREHAKLGGLFSDVAWSAFETAFTDGVGALDADLVGRVVDLPAWVQSGPAGGDFTDRVGLYLRVGAGEKPVHSPTGQRVATVLDTRLNSVVAVASPVVALAARIYGQCEVNAWIAGQDRGWLADLIEHGLATDYAEIGTARADEPYLRGTTLFSDSDRWRSHYDGWAATARMLREDGDGIVVLDYSVTDGFPSKRWAAFPAEPGKRFNHWWRKATPEQAWNASARGLTEYTRTGPALLQISPDNLRQAGYGLTEAWTWHDLAAAWRAAGTKSMIASPDNTVHA
jgi:hypothetical protein